MHSQIESCYCTGKITVKQMEASAQVQDVYYHLKGYTTVQHGFDLQ